MRALILSHFSYCSPVWMSYDRTLDHRKKSSSGKVQERVAYNDYGTDFGFLLEQTNSVPTHIRNLQLLMT